MDRPQCLSNSVEGWDVFQWPEFKALAQRLGIPLDLKTTKLTLTLECEKVVTCEHTYQAVDVRGKHEHQS